MIKPEPTGGQKDIAVEKGGKSGEKTNKPAEDRNRTSKRYEKENSF